MNEFERRYIETLLAVRAASPEMYDQLCAAMSALRDQYRDRALNAGADNTMFLAMGFARGVNEITRLTVNAAALHDQITGRA